MQDTKELNFNATGTIAVAVMFSRLLGLIREILFNDLFGASLMGLFLVAFRAPNLLRDLFAEGVLSIAFITIFSQTIEKEGEASAWRLASKILTLVSIFMGVISLFGCIYAKNIVAILAPGFSTDNMVITVLLTQIMYPFIFFVSLSALIMGILNSKNVFGIPALASSFFNIGSISGGIFFGWLIDPHFGSQALIGLAIGTIIGGILQLIIQIPSLRHVGFHFKPDFKWNDISVRNTLILTVPGIIAASAVQINVLISSAFSSYIGTSAVTWLNSAFRLVQLPIGIFGVAVSTITLPVISRIAARNDFELFGFTISKALRFVVFLTMPVTVFLFVLAEPIVKLIYEHGKFYSEDSLQTALAVQLYSLGLLAYSCIKVLAPTFYAIGRKWVPMFVSFASIFINVLLNYFLIFKYDMGHKGLALSTAIAALINFSALLGLLARSYNLQLNKFTNNFIQCGISSTVLALICWVSMSLCDKFIYTAPLYFQVLFLTITFLTAGSAYIAMSLLLKIEGTSILFKALSQRMTSKENVIYHNMN